jgi:hypothetical protein
MIIIKPIFHAELFRSFWTLDNATIVGLNHDIVLVNTANTIVSSRKSVKIYNQSSSSTVTSPLKTTFEIQSEPFFLDMNNISASVSWTVNKLRIFQETSQIILAEVTIPSFVVGPIKSFRFYTEGLILISQDEIDQPD